MATIDHRWSSSIMTYATFSKGVKGGGFQQRVIVPRILQLTFGPEKLTAYEIGAKTDFFDRRLRVTVAALPSNYNDLDVTTFPGRPTSLAPDKVNAGRLRIRGLQAELRARPRDAVTQTHGMCRLN